MFDLFRKTASPIIGALDADQAESCAAIHADSFTFAWPSGDIESLLLTRTTIADGAYGGDTLQGFVLSRLAADEAEVLTIAVRPKFRGKGLAARLMTANMERLTLAGAKSWFLEVEAQNTAALALYRRFGFERVGERKSYYRKADGDSAMAYILRRDLR